MAHAPPTERYALAVDELSIDCLWWGHRPYDSPVIVLLHEGLGSATQWRDLPERLIATTGLPVFAYSRRGYGRSTTASKGFEIDFMHREADLLPRVLRSVGIDEHVLVGHSDGGSIALLAAAQGNENTIGLATIAAHAYVEQVCLEGIREITQRRQQVASSLARHHSDPLSTFDAWSNVWLDPNFGSWSILEALGTISCPTLVIQGDNDQYATPSMATDIAGAIPTAQDPLFLSDCGHNAHHTHCEALASAIALLLSGSTDLTSR